MDKKDEESYRNFILHSDSAITAKFRNIEFDNFHKAVVSSSTKKNFYENCDYEKKYCVYNDGQTFVHTKELTEKITKVFAWSKATCKYVNPKKVKTCELMDVLDGAFGHKIDGTPKKWYEYFSKKFVANSFEILAFSF